MPCPSSHKTLNQSQLDPSLAGRKSQRTETFSDNLETEKENLDNGAVEGFKIPDVPLKRKRGRPRKSNPDGCGLYEGPDDGEPEEKSSGKKFQGRGRKKIVPMSLKMCSECGEEFDDHASNLTHWKDKHPG